MTWVVLGGSGFVGSAVLATLHRAGIDAHAVRAPRLESPARTPDALVREASGTDVTGLAALLVGAEVVVNAAGLATPSAGWSAELSGANALLPAVVLRAAAEAGARLVLHLSSAAVQGRRTLLDETPEVAPFSAYSHSKALGEQALALQSAALPGVAAVTVRATSVQGTGRPTTAALARLARSPLASVAAPGDAPSPVTSVAALADLVLSVGLHEGELPRIVLQPWEGLSTSDVLEAAGGHPRELPPALCRITVRAGYAASALLRGRLDGHVRRVELMWFGQGQARGWAEAVGAMPVDRIRSVLAGTADDAGNGLRAG